MKWRVYLLVFGILFLFCNSNTKQLKTIGTIERLSPELDAIISKNAVPEIIAEGFDWSEGPLWVESEKMLLFSDVPTNKIFKWTEKHGAELYLTPSGYTGSTPRGGEMGSNGLLLDKNGNLVMCQHGDRRMARMNASLNAPKPDFVTLADNYQGKKLNSPNDAIFKSNGDLYFTDPPYGLIRNINDPLKEIPFQGVYKLSKGKVTLLTDSISMPNGIGFLNNERSLIVSSSDPRKAVWYLFDLDKDGSLTNPRILMNVSSLVRTMKGLPDGLKVDKQDNIFAVGPGGVFIFNREGKQIGKISVPDACSNVALADDDKTLYITNDMNILRVKMR